MIRKLLKPSRPPRVIYCDGSAGVCSVAASAAAARDALRFETWPGGIRLS